MLGYSLLRGLCRRDRLACLLNLPAPRSHELGTGGEELEFIMLRYHRLLGVAGFIIGFATSAQSAESVLLSANAHVCNTEAEVARLAQNEQLQEMARALVEFKPTQYCFILPDAASVTVLEQQPGYIKFDYKSQILYTFSKYVSAIAITAKIT
jgi:hypothetical protein